MIIRILPYVKSYDYNIAKIHFNYSENYLMPKLFLPKSFVESLSFPLVELWITDYTTLHIKSISPKDEIAPIGLVVNIEKRYISASSLVNFYIHQLEISPKTIISQLRNGEFPKRMTLPLRDNDSGDSELLVSTEPLLRELSKIRQGKLFIKNSLIFPSLNIKENTCLYFYKRKNKRVLFKTLLPWLKPGTQIIYLLVDKSSNYLIIAKRPLKYLQGLGELEPIGSLESKVPEGTINFLKDCLRDLPILIKQLDCEGIPKNPRKINEMILRKIKENKKVCMPLVEAQREYIVVDMTPLKKFLKEVC
ncbi:hypothetical protein A3L09_10745 (plasmid) [Thermococcus profundus]|uniref:Uncharacterized protein n=1 Tax=Thermococcus profundus TaxID=49899 RepID=A0A2Z2MPM5_THEPR|nr:hypothetical protein [Thermococcus profundus]ASJ03828.1 hypothetical protein A3L09_10745 [Thermococcus profundus]